MSKTVFTQVETSDSKVLYLLTEYEEDELQFNITVTDGSKVWKSTVSEEDLDDMRRKVKMDMESFIEKTTEALTTSKRSGGIFQYKFKIKKDNSAEFTWQKYVPDQHIAFQLGSTTLHPTDHPSGEMCLIFNHCIERQSQLLERIQNVETDNERLSQERVNALTRLDKCVLAKEEIEKDLYSKFVDILNKKKEKIRQLQQQVESGTVAGQTQDASEHEDEPSTSNGTRTINTKRKVPQKDSDEDTTDDEQKIKQSKRGRYPRSSPNKSGDDSLILDDGDDSPPQKPVARRSHARGVNKKQTPSKPVLPKVTSKEKSSLEKKLSMKKSGSSSSNRSSDNLDADALLDGL